MAGAQMEFKKLLHQDHSLSSTFVSIVFLEIGHLLENGCFSNHTAKRIWSFTQCKREDIHIFFSEKITQLFAFQKMLTPTETCQVIQKYTKEISSKFQEIKLLSMTKLILWILKLQKLLMRSLQLEVSKKMNKLKKLHKS